MSNVRKHVKHITTIAIVVIVFISGFIIGNIHSITNAQGVPTAIGDTEEAFAPLYETLQIIQSRYVDASQVDVPTLVDAAVEGMINGLEDPYSYYMDPAGFNLFMSDFSGNVEGIGAVVTTNEETGMVEVVQVLKGTGAEAAGVMPGDIFVEVDGENVEGMNQSELVAKVRGPAGSQVTITFRRGEDLVTLTITRSRIELPNVEYSMLEDNFAYISMAEFNDLSRTQLDAALEALDVNSTNGLIFDLRDNPGGLLSSAIDVGSLFIEDGVIVYEAFGDGSEDTMEANGTFGNITVPIVVLVNENSASASELVAGAIQDTGVAYLIGETTFGKGTVQTLQQLSNGGGVRITIARYLLPSRRWVHEQGVTPDLVVPYDPMVDGTETDPQLQAAIDYLKTQ
jgi:carboxyl-terminal processing protease